MSRNAVNRNKRSPGADYAGSHQRSWLWGRHAVLETLTAARWPVLELWAASELPPPDQQRVAELAARQGLRLQVVSSARLQQLCHQPDHQGLLARMGQFPYADQAALLTAARKVTASGSPGLFVLCDRLQDPHNFGAVLRCCDAVAADGIIVGLTGQTPVTSHVARASSGAVNHLQLFQITSLADGLQSLRQQGFRAVAATEKAEGSLWQTDLTGPVVLIIGSEATGISPQLLQHCDLQVGIPMLGKVGSLNAAVAAGILLYECRRRNQKGASE
ncbi:MAG: 23S rRNA (guanosine(2251)-2'-O)-methyltransferase RlmB [Planctomyces sp.]|nr:23S rRNA (guanosine(2251)-2'-O)-methyltransferase RlmB [Planctomyces sp.]